MQFDKNAIFADNQAITATATSTNVIATGTDISGGTPVPFATMITESFNNLTSLKLAIETADDESFTSATTIYEETIPLADLKEGNLVGTRFFPKGAKKYCREKFTVVTNDGASAPTKGKIKSGVVVAVPTSYEDM